MLNRHPGNRRAKTLPPEGGLRRDSRWRVGSRHRTPSLTQRFLRGFIVTSPNPNLGVDYAGMNSAGAEMNALVQAFLGYLQSINTEMATLQSTWTGDASNKFNTAMDTWENSFRAINNKLAEMADLLGHNVIGYQNTETDAAGIAPQWAQALPALPGV
jgi:WXG100 family type VII secretion target